MKIQKILWAAIAVAGITAASPITFTISTSGSGTLGSLVFTDATIIFTAVTDTTFILNGPIVIGDAGNQTSSPMGTDTITLLGLNTWTMSDPTFFYDDRTMGVVGFEDLDESIDTDLNVLDISGTPFSSYDLKSSLGPISDPLVFGSGNFTGPTSGGILSFTTNSTNASFQAVTTSASAPEPGSLGLMLAGAVILHVWRSKIVRRGYDLHESCADRNCVVAGCARDAARAGARGQRFPDSFC
jgi:hypothetical protein